ncbi:isopeptide-forming domain-containing fimbrial protein [Collinsella aerofaciens]|uniref:isopeptide-forming domain-containing fimbrial protein n=1 Tax=Collinsella aerofaciens TaxID=74426 RepID=UPI001E4E80D5|nr:isopeptide-forming domain-containing fimbrial protein [Collinsella aerofaciens]MDB1857488.1 isopeptide-forming domain-containing fimbrial protein [Collinsella aerofaciens]
MSKNIARLAVTAGLTAALSFGGVMAPVTMAFADDVAAATTNSITINKNTENGDAKYKAYQIFKADVVDKDGKKVASNVDWADGLSAAAKNGIIAAIKSDEKGGELPETPSAQDVADWMATYLQDASQVVNNGDLLDTIASLVKDTTPVTPRGASTAAFAADISVSFDNSGYYLFLTDVDSIGTADSHSGKKQTGTSPIFAVVGGSAVEVTEKTSIPTVEKKVKDDKPGSDWKDKADSQMDQDVHYQLTGTVADNIATFDTYYYEFNDVLSAGLTADAGTIEVKIGDKTLSRNSTEGDKTGYDASIDNTTNTLTVKFTDLKTAANVAGATLDGRSNVVVTYTAKLDHKKVDKVTVGGEGNPNSVKLIYSNNPMSDGKGESVLDTVRDYTYALKLVKEDSEDNTKLKDVEFTIKATGADELETGKVGLQYVQENGSLGNDEHRFKTNESGEISVTGLDAGTYTVHEVEGSNPGYNTLDDFTFTITAEGLGELEGKTFAGNTDPNTLKVTAGKDGSTLVTPKVTDGTVTLTVKNKKGSNLPLTGLNGVTFTWIAGGAVLCIGVAHLIRSRKQAEESEQE